MRNAVNNPFSPGADVVPTVWAGRTEQLSDWRDIVRPRRLAGLPERGRTFLGEPGLGKSSLVRRIAQDAERSGDWVSPQLRMPSGTDPLKLVADALLKLADLAGLPASRDERISAAIERVQTVAIAGISLTVRRQEGMEPYAALTKLLIEIGRAAIDHGNLVLIHIDEIQNIGDQNALSQLLIALGDALAHEDPVTVPGGARVSRSLPLAVYLTGLPDFEDMAGAGRGATFARRFKTTTLIAIDDEDVEASLHDFVLDGWEVPDDRGGTTRIRMESDAASDIVAACCGEPFLLQLAGERAWYAGTGDTITADDVARGWSGAETEAASHVERILRRLPAREREFLETMARLPPSERTLTTIAEELGYAKVTEAGSASQRLDTVRGIISRGRPYSFRHRAVEAYLTSDWPKLGR
ncbi:ATP-binding protein [Agromyces archimandritae]|uniref:ATP-binding protein n=1 Tax=Agromyces archimandritae TaxID=2781962 RepID=A0A975FNZ0_9MICO|nr:ATP-binding protein [Agromyces archimandritae]QTX05680.1 ATP-binding protein [Agromyces archimandritae]